MSESNGYATVDDFARAAKAPRRTREVELPVSGLKVQIRSLSEKEKSGFEAQQQQAKGKTAHHRQLVAVRRRLIVLCTTQPVLTSENFATLGDMDGKDVTVWGNACTEIVGFSEEEMDSLEGNSEASGDNSQATE